MELGRRGWGRVDPNPMVGCVVVRDGRAVAEGWHREVGGPHAEVEALREAGEAARGACVYVSLEPCAHEGRTPPCTRALIAAGVARVVYGAADPGERSGGGSAVLRAAGIDVRGPLLTEEQALRENPAFFARARGRAPWVELKLALSLDGAIAARAGERTVLTGPEAGEETHRLRAGVQGIMVGVGTVLADDPLLTARGEPKPRTPPLRIILDTHARTPPTARLMRDVQREGDVLVFVGESAPQARIELLRRAGGEVVRLPGGSAGTGSSGLDLGAALAELGARGVACVLCEGGARVARSLLSDGRVDRMHLVFTPRFLGPTGLPGVQGVDPGGAGRWELGEEPLAFGSDLWTRWERAA